jgi:UDP-N-acetyl-D-glucosamine dehydrogenase
VADGALKNQIQSGNLEFSSDFSTVSKCEIVILAVPTPLDKNRNPDLSYVESAVISVAPYFSPGTLLISESTSYPGTVRSFIVEKVREVNPEIVMNLDFASAPERVDPGNKTFDHSNTPRIVGGLTDKARDRAIDFYSTLTSEVHSASSLEVAELAKLLENTFRQVNIAFVNEFAQVCRKLGVDVREVIAAASSKPYGFMPFHPSAGVGGHCIPVDPSYLSWIARQNGITAQFIELANQVNAEMPAYVVSRFQEISQLSSGKILILGVAYKPGVSDTRETPATGVKKALAASGFSVEWLDPLVTEWEASSPCKNFDEISGAIVVTAQPGLPIDLLLEKKLPILDCTGTYSNVREIAQL